ncbi:hypothetical protein [Klenkia brasiliensis]|uniref:Uncharacterized protein n=1 Tax=Klenkia brasiliensis TaxID=333142 RepID=A0A1G7PE35_9ACTN|nr:hypothetical protein [Klenkia brasiliensis]SDF84444.1 hypothetical protein SAMN05660324_1051 [Klenkia brasiliensis]
MIATVEVSREATTARLRPLLRAVQEALVAGVVVSGQIHRQHGWQRAADPHLDRQLVRRHAMEQLLPWSASVGEQLTFDVGDGAGENLGLPMSGLIITTEADVVRVWYSEDGELPPADTAALRAFYAQAPTTQLALDGTPPVGNHVALLWADRGGALSRLELVRPWWRGGRHPEADWRADLLR